MELSELITAREAATILGCSRCHAQRLTADLDGQIVDGRWLFRRDLVTDYAQQKGGADGLRPASGR
jgi:hypothetical protein